jgi:hypothetical protein
MVWNVLKKDLDMRHHEYMQTMYRIDSLKKEIQQWHSLLDKLVEDTNYTGYPSHYASHMNTGIVYDKRVIGDNLTRLNQEMEDLEEKLNNDKY